MIRKIALLAIPAMALILALSTDNSQAFAKGGMSKGGRNMSKFHHGFDRHFRHFDRYGWNYGFGYVEPIVEVPVVATACPTAEVAPVAPVCTTCEPAVSVVTPEYITNWGYGKYGKFRNDYRHHREHREHPLAHGNRGGRK
jgi:hypothetical protein